MSTKERLLALLEEQKGEHLSGEHLAQILGVSRNAVWKAINELRKTGHLIDAVRNKGYCLDAQNNILSREGLLPFLDKNIDVPKINIFESLESTNKTAKEMAIANAEHGTIVLSNRQTGGKGRYGRSFFSPPYSGIYISFILRPQYINLSSMHLITLLAAVSVCESIEDVYGRSPKIKWVNDILLENKKVGGILTEAVTDFESGNLQWIVLGIGLNVTTKTEDFPEKLQPIAGSIHPTKGCSPTRIQLVAKLINTILNHKNLKDETGLIEQYRGRLAMLGQEITVIHGGESYPATAVDINAQGNLIVKDKSGHLRTLASGEISIRL